jgi:hypothetical protein
MKFAIFLQNDSQTQAAIKGLHSEYGNAAKIVDATTLEVWDAISDEFEMMQTIEDALFTEGVTPLEIQRI